MKLIAAILGRAVFPVLAVALSLNTVLIRHRVPLSRMVEFVRGHARLGRVGRVSASANLSTITDPIPRYG